ncbi:hypothetical protein [Rhodopirellula baltica]|uniref:Uncharacterized protein n=1 Tax=Rhodopirellula baltica SWK14 TaxID=993516 RepID=L7CKP4_RHOBT|nr:hypothetical protein [Rhodopirellula baltica]ELP34538.1 hypothetical protein RBSWK_01548 [Rhodopirellula baltica SWK14]
MLEIVNLLASNPVVLLFIVVLVFFLLRFAVYYGKFEWNGSKGSYLGGYWKDAASHEKTDE